MNLKVLRLGNTRTFDRIKNAKKSTVSNLTSVRRSDVTNTDSGVFPFPSRIADQYKMDLLNRSNSQGMSSYIQSHTLLKASDVPNGIPELSALSAKGNMPDRDRENYNIEFVALSEQLFSPKKSKYGDTKIIEECFVKSEYITQSNAICYENNSSIKSYSSNIISLDDSFAPVGCTTCDFDGDLQWNNGSEVCIKETNGSGSVECCLYTNAVGDNPHLCNQQLSLIVNFVNYSSYYYGNYFFNDDANALEFELGDFDPLHIVENSFINCEIVYAGHSISGYITVPSSDRAIPACWSYCRFVNFYHGSGFKVNGNAVSFTVVDEVTANFNFADKENEARDPTLQSTDVYRGISCLHSGITEADYKNWMKYITTCINDHLNTNKPLADVRGNSHLSCLRSWEYLNNNEHTDPPNRYNDKMITVL
jgi:hypothetical protein